MVRSRIFIKLYASYAAIIVFCTLIVSLMIERQIEQESLIEIEKSLKSQALMLRDSIPASLLSRDRADLQSLVERLGSDIDTRITLVAADGGVLADSEQDPREMENHLNRPELQQADAEGFGTITRYSSTLSKSMLYLALPVVDERFSGYIRVARSLSQIEQRLDHIRNIVIIAGSLTGVMALLLGFIIARSFASPINQMTKMAQLMSEGDYRQRLDIVRRDEMGELAATLNHLAETAVDRVETITTSRNQLAAIITGMVEGVIAVDYHQKIIHINKAAAEIIGKPADDCLGKPISAITNIDLIREAISRTLRLKQTVQSELKLVSPQGDSYFNLYAAVLHEVPAQPSGAILVIHDVSEIHRSENAQRDFVANASHELKTPITAIQGLSESMLEDEHMAADTRKRFLQKVHDQSLRLSTLVADLLTLSRLESDVTSTFRQVDLSLLIRHTCTDMESIARQQTIKLTAQITDGEVPVIGDEKSLGQLLINLIDNAIKYSTSNGQVGVSLNVTKDQAIVEVEDDGIGIATSEQVRIFERFYRVDKARSKELGGTGLGLAIVKHIAQLHDGVVEVDSSLSNGSLFRVILPLAVN